MAEQKNRDSISLAGFTLLEVLLATIIISVVVTALLEAFSIGLFATTDRANMENALNIAQANMELIKNKDFNSINTTAKISGFISNLGFSNFNISANVANATVDQKVLQVDLTVSWAVAGGQANTTLTTFVASY